MRNTFADTFYQAGQKDSRLCVVVADISPAGSIAKFRQEFPDRFINTGVAEQIMIGLCAGMAHRGLRPFAYTIATFALFRPFEMVRDDLCYQDLPVTVVGIGGGVNYSTLGGTHHAMEDVSIACSVPNLRVIAPCDPAETRAATLWCVHEAQAPVYLRLGKAGEPDLTQASDDPWVFGEVRFLRRGRDVCIFSYGPIMKLAVALADRLAAAGKSASVVSVHTLKPLDREGIARALSSHRHAVVIEECAANGGLGMQIKALARDQGISCRMDAFSLRDEFIHFYGSHEQLLSEHGLNLESIFARVGAP